VRSAAACSRHRRTHVAAHLSPRLVRSPGASSHLRCAAAQLVVRHSVRSQLSSQPAHHTTSTDLSTQELNCLLLAKR